MNLKVTLNYKIHSWILSFFFNSTIVPYFALLFASLPPLLSSSLLLASFDFLFFCTSLPRQCQLPITTRYRVLSIEYRVRDSTGV